jgi:hypothetical protein
MSGLKFMLMPFSLLIKNVTGNHDNSYLMLGVMIDNIYSHSYTQLHATKNHMYLAKKLNNI